MNTKSKVAGAFIGLAIGDALGAPVDTKERGTFSLIKDMKGGGKFNLPIGCWTDDTATALCLAKSLLATHELDVYDFMERLKTWLKSGENSSTGTCLDLDQNIHNVIINYEKTGTIELNLVDQRSDENSALVRSAPIACIHWDNLDTVSRISKQQSYLTQGSEISASACDYLGLTISHLIAGRTWDYVCNMPIDPDWSVQIKSIANCNWKSKKVDQIYSTRSACDTLEAACWCIDSAKNFEEALISAVNFGGSSSTLGAVTGQIAGALYGLESIPIRWFDQLAHIDNLTDLALQMVDLSRSE
jgi:ADP-ribosyl-[dinitrogen reductase] hydrolase